MVGRVVGLNTRAMGTATIAMAVACLGCSVEPRGVHLELRPPEALGCRPTEVTEVLLTPRGDFPFQASLRLDLTDGPVMIDRFPPETELVSVAASGLVRSGEDIETWTGGGVAVLDEAELLAIPLLRLRRACALSDVRARGLEGASVLALSDGRLFMAGGFHSALGVLDTIVTIRPGDRLADDSAMRLFVPRTEASATATADGLLVVAGGRSAVDGTPLPTFEVFRADGAEEGADDGFLMQPRAAHGATRLPDGRLLLVGGQGVGGPLASAELLEVEGGQIVASIARGSLAFARVRPYVATLDDGTVLVAGGGAEAIERYDPATDRFEVVGSFRDSRPGEAFAALSGGRLARIGGESDSEWSREIEIALAEGTEVVSLGDVLENRIVSPVATDTGDGRILVVGGHTTLGRVAEIVDPGGTRTANERALEPLVPSRVPNALVRLRDGSIAELDPDGVSLVRLEVRTELDQSGANIFAVQTSNNHQLSLDVATRWRPEGEVLVAADDGARFDLPGARFADVDVELEVLPPIEILWVRDGALPVPLGVGVDAPCTIEAGGEPIEIHLSRRGRFVTIEHDGVNEACELDLPPRVGLAVRAARGAGVRRFSFTRR